jgi:hypothetical protein
MIGILSSSTAEALQVLGIVLLIVVPLFAVLLYIEHRRTRPRSSQGPVPSPGKREDSSADCGCPAQEGDTQRNLPHQPHS